MLQNQYFGLHDSLRTLFFIGNAIVIDSKCTEAIS